MKIKKPSVVTLVAAVRDNDGIDLRAVRNSNYELTGIASVSKEEYDKNTQSIISTQSTSGASEEGDPNGDLSEQMDLLAQYGAFGVSFNATGEMIYNGELVRYFCDGVELEAGIWSTHYQYLNGKGTVDVFTKRTVIDIGDGGQDLFGNLIGLEKSSQKEFEQRDLSEFSASSNQITTVAEDNSDGATGMTFSEIFSKYKDFGVTYKEERAGGNRGNVYYNGELVQFFVDENENGGIFSYTSENGGEITVYTIYDSNGNLIGVEER